MATLRLGPILTSSRFGVGLFRGGAWLVLLGATAVLVRAEAERNPLPKGVSEHADLVYRQVDGREVRLDLYLPESLALNTRRPAVVAIHGGGWRGGSKSDMRGMATQLAEHGYVVAAIDYQLSRPGQPSWPLNFEDCRGAVRWLRRHAADYGVDPDRIVALGASAGGHLAAMLGTYPDGAVSPNARNPSSSASPPSADSARVEAVVDLYGPTDLAGVRSRLPLPTTPVALLLGGSSDQLPGRAKAASPVRHVSSDDPPMFLVHGRDDQLVPLEQSETFAAALEDAGVRHRLLVVDHAAHGFGFHAGDRKILPEILAFLDSVWNAKVQRLIR